MKRAAVVPYRSIPDASEKLNKLSSAQSPLLAMFWVASQNTAVKNVDVSKNFALDPVAHLNATVQKLLEQPITNVEGLLRGLGPAELNAKGKSLCGEVSAVLTKFPFSSRAQTQATALDVDSAFKPKEGALWTFYDSTLAKYLLRDGAQFQPDPGAPVRLNHFFYGLPPMESPSR